jgi:hypothetical protein
MKPQTNTFSKYCEDNIKKVLHKVYAYYTMSIQHTVGKNNFCTKYGSFSDVRNSSTE